MKTTRSHLASLALLTLAVLVGCAGAGPARVDQTSATGTSERSSDEAMLPEGVRATGTYTAASGRLCRHLVDRRGAPVARTSCRRADGGWTLGRALDGARPRVIDPGEARLNGTPAAALPSTGAGIQTGSRAGVGDVIGVELRKNETLWRFSMRTTGDPRNWQRIARLNGIEDAMQVSPGRTLSVPASITSPAL